MNDLSCPELLASHIVKEEQTITGGGPVSDDEDHLGHDGEFPDDMETLKQQLHRFDGGGSTTGATSAHCEEALGLSFEVSMGGTMAGRANLPGHHHHHPPSSAINDDLALLVGRPDERGYFHCPADACDRKYKIKYSLLRHLRNECNADRRHSCPMCNKKFSYAFILNRHLLNVHKESPGFY
uniref:C2H2-type domain-containing protein n=1 Tax=Anopheles culicifacies TaxID=139723 RepID=A0A182MHK9_9DIPT